MSNEPLRSHHIFVFPFNWDNGNNDLSFAERTSLVHLHKLLKDKPLSAFGNPALRWERFQFTWDEGYNEAIYFHPFVRDALFDKGNGAPDTVLQYHIDGKGKELTYNVKVGHEHQYQLHIVELTLNFYETGIGCLAFHLNNYEYHKPEEILRINDFGRRIFPQFLDKNGEENRLKGPKSAFLSERITLLAGTEVLCEDDFTKVSNEVTRNGNDYSNASFLLPDFITKWFPQAIKSNLVCIQPLIDDRMHVLCWASANNQWIGKIKNDYSERAAMLLNSFIFVDGSTQSGHSNFFQARDYNHKHTYKRWADDKLYYGICRYSFVILADEKKDFHRDVILKHLQTIYFQIVLLSLLQRGSIVRFSEEITKLSQQVAKGGKISRHSDDVQSLYGKYLHFVNNIYFREVTPQEQGIEIYKMVQSNMEVERDIKALQQEIHDFFKLLDLKAGNQQTDALNLLTMVGAALLVPALILAYYGISSFLNIVPEWKPQFLFRTAVFCGLGSLSAFLTAYYWVNQKTIKYLFLIITLLLLALAAWLPFSYPVSPSN